MNTNKAVFLLLSPGNSVHRMRGEAAEGEAGDSMRRRGGGEEEKSGEGRQG